jgi:heat shock protein HslJ
MNIFKYIKKALVFGMAVFCLTLAFQSPSYAATLEGNWRLESLGGFPVLRMTEITAQFHDAPNGDITGTGGCNRYFGGFSTDSGNIKIGPVASTFMACDQLRMRQESRYFQALQSATSYEVSDENMQLTSGSDNQSLKYVKAK